MPTLIAWLGTAIESGLHSEWLLWRSYKQHQPRAREAQEIAVVTHSIEFGAHCGRVGSQKCGYRYAI